LGGALDAPPEFAFPIIQAIGWTSLHWARLEQHLDVLLITLHKQVTTKPLKRRPDSSWAKKVEVFSSWFAEHDQFKEFATTANRLATNFENDGLDRNMLLHSNCIDFVEGPPSKMVALSIRNNAAGDIEQKRAGGRVTRYWSLRTWLPISIKQLQGITSVVLTEIFLRSLGKS
jgi:hypothetical protein